MSKLPSIKELTNDIEMYNRLDEFNLLMNQNPPKEWLKRNPFGGNALYIPIERVEFLLKRIFKNYKIEVREIVQIFNGVSCTVRLHYIHPITGEWSFHDGVGAGQIQTKKGSSPADMQNINNNAIQLCVPIARAEAVKNAAKTFGKLFGSDLNRKSSPNYNRELIPMGEGHPNWDKLCQAVGNGEYSVEEILKGYDLSPEDIQKLKDIEPS